MSLVNVHKKKYDLLIISVSKIDSYDLIVDEFFLNKSEYEDFSKSIKNDPDRTYSWFYTTKRINLFVFAEETKLEIVDSNSDELLLSINKQLKNVAYEVVRDGKKTSINKINEYSARMNINDYIEKNIKLRNIDDIDYSFNQITNGEYCAFRMYNIGQGNMSALFIGDKLVPKILFDLGCSRKCSSAINLLSKNMVLNSNNRIITIFISHFHNDHINMAKYLPSGGLSLQFIIPEFLSPTDMFIPNVSLLLYKAILNGNCIYVVKNDSLVTPLNFGNLILYQGSSRRKDVNQFSDENSHGLVVTLNIKDKVLLIPGDTLYEDIYTTLKSPLKPTHVIIPHHACQYLTPINSKILDLTRLEETFTFCAQHRGYHHPNATHFKQYLLYSSNLKRLVRNEKKYIVFDKTAIIKDSFYTILHGDFYDLKF